MNDSNKFCTKSVRIKIIINKPCGSNQHFPYYIIMPCKVDYSMLFFFKT